jgi:glycosyltransferase involved in cell wall biosynthesis
MKIVQILPEMNAGGVELVTLELASHLARAGHQSIVISNGGRLVGALESSGARHVAMPVHRKHPATLLQVACLRRFFLEERPDIIHIASRAPGWVAWLAWRSLDPKIRPKFVSTVHGFYSVNRYSAIMTRGERVIAVSESIRQYILKNYPKTPPERIRVIPGGVDPTCFFPSFRPSPEWQQQWQADHPQLADQSLLLLPGRITRLKGHADFINLIASLRSKGVPAHGLIAGDTHPKKRAYLDELHSLVDQLGVCDSITFLGHRKDIREVMATSDLICALSQQPESFGRTVLEAMALGKPVVGYDCGGVGELLAAIFPEGKVPLGDLALAGRRTEEILSQKPLPRQADAYTLARTLQAHLDIYAEVLATP